MQKQHSGTDWRFGSFLRSGGWTSPECRAGTTWLCSLPLSLFLIPTQEHAFLGLCWSILIHPSPSRFLFLSWFLPSSLNYWDQGWPFSCGTSIIKGTASLREAQKKKTKWLIMNRNSWDFKEELLQTFHIQEKTKTLWSVDKGIKHKHTANQTHMSERGDELWNRGLRLRLWPVLHSTQINNLQYSQVPCLQAAQCIQEEFRRWAYFFNVVLWTLQRIC